MKKIDDFTQEELADLGEEDVERLIEIEIAIAGIQPALCPKTPSLQEEGIVMSEIAYKVRGILLVKREDAEAIARMTVLGDKYDYNIGYAYQWLEPELNMKIEEKAFYKKDDISRIAPALQSNEAKRKEYERQKEAYDAWLKKTGQIRQATWGKFNDARRWLDEATAAKEAYNRYLDLADQDEEIAKKFFWDAYKDRSDLIEYVLNEKPEV